MTPGPIQSDIVYYPAWTMIQMDMDLASLGGGVFGHVLWDGDWGLSSDFNWFKADLPWCCAHYEFWSFNHAASSVYALYEPLRLKHATPIYDVTWNPFAETTSWLPWVFYFVGTVAMLRLAYNKWRRR